MFIFKLFTLYFLLFYFAISELLEEERHRKNIIYSKKYQQYEIYFHLPYLGESDNWGKRDGWNKGGGGWVWMEGRFEYIQVFLFPANGFYRYF